MNDPALSVSQKSRHAAAFFIAGMLASTRFPSSVWGRHMILIANCLVAVVAALHVYFLVLEMFLWTKPLGLKTFRNTPEKAADSAVLAANQGLYNGFLVAVLIWGLVQGVPGFAFQIKTFFLLCVIVAGAYGAATVSRRILVLGCSHATTASRSLAAPRIRCPTICLARTPISTSIPRRTKYH
jgi:putative membrane protein